MNIDRALLGIVLGAVASLGNTTQATEIAWDGRSLLKYCSPEPTMTAEATASPDAYCLGYLHGLMDMKNEATTNSKLTFSSCAPSELTTQYARHVVVAYLKAHPERLNLASSTLVLSALAEAFPCPDAKKRGSKPK